MVPASRSEAARLGVNRYFTEFFYATRAYISQETGQAWHVDHTHHNLRIIPAVENLKKGNRFE